VPSPERPAARKTQRAGQGDRIAPSQPSTRAGTPAYAAGSSADASEPARTLTTSCACLPPLSVELNLAHAKSAGKRGDRLVGDVESLVKRVDNLLQLGLGNDQLWYQEQ
jgi:hypothetical protein